MTPTSIRQPVVVLESANDPDLELSALRWLIEESAAYAATKRAQKAADEAA